jgi:hypothetical protein
MISVSVLVTRLVSCLRLYLFTFPLTPQNSILEKVLTLMSTITMTPAAFSIILFSSYCCRVVRSVVDHGLERWTHFFDRWQSSVLCGRQYCSVCCVCCLGRAYSCYPGHDGGPVCLPSHTSIALVSTAWIQYSVPAVTWHLNGGAPKKLWGKKKMVLFCFLWMKWCELS